MTVHTFDAAISRDLCRRAAAVRGQARLRGVTGWQRSAADPATLLAVFDTLQLKPEYRLCAYQYVEGRDGHGVIWAIPAGSACPEPNRRQNDEPPRPQGALDDLRAAVAGDGSPLSYLSASLFAREALEFGAFGHGTSWGAYHIIGTAPWQGEAPGDGYAEPGGTAADWEWDDVPPQTWAPSVAVTPDQVTVTFYTFCGLGTQRIIRHTDVYTPGDYRFVTQADVIARGPGGYVW
ncbi:MAG TPA: hypothetical protein VNT75_11905 [Symbiobacteriaceae bacterium]|nr:hypothetical protein [Symbiobacteriaceae bacterium]